MIIQLMVPAQQPTWFEYLLGSLCIDRCTVANTCPHLNREHYATLKDLNFAVWYIWPKSANSTLIQSKGRSPDDRFER